MEDIAFLLDESELSHQLLIDKLVVLDQFFGSSNPKVSTINFATSHLVISWSQLPATTSWFLEAVDNTEATSHQESDLLGSKETQFCVGESNELQVGDGRQNSRYGEYWEVYETFSRLVK